MSSAYCFFCLKKEVCGGVPLSNRDGSCWWCWAGCPSWGQALPCPAAEMSWVQPGVEREMGEEGLCSPRRCWLEESGADEVGSQSRQDPRAQCQAALQAWSWLRGAAHPGGVERLRSRTGGETCSHEDAGFGGKFIFKLFYLVCHIYQVWDLTF